MDDKRKYDLDHKEPTEKNTKKYLPINNRVETALIDLGTILYIEQFGRKVLIHATDKIHYQYCKISEFEKYLDGRFYKSLKYTIVNLDQIRLMKGQTITFKSNSTMILGRDSFVRTKQAFALYHHISKQYK